jgi:nitroreductase
MELDKVIQSRKSIKKFSSKKPDWRDILEAINSARFAPMAGNIYSPRFILVDDIEKIQKLAEASEQSFVSKVSYIVVVCSENKMTKNSFEERAEKFLRQQAGATIENFLLKIQELNLATCWVGHLNEDKVKKILNIPENTNVEAIFPIGYESKAIGSNKRKNKIDLDRILYFNKYGNNKMNKK